MAKKRKISSAGKMLRSSTARSALNAKRAFRAAIRTATTGHCDYALAHFASGKEAMGVYIGLRSQAEGVTHRTRGAQSISYADERAFHAITQKCFR